MNKPYKNSGGVVIGEFEGQKIVHHGAVGPVENMNRPVDQSFTVAKPSTKQALIKELESRQANATVRVEGGWTGTPVTLGVEKVEFPPETYALVSRGVTGGVARYLMSRDEMIALCFQMAELTCPVTKTGA